MPKYLTFVAVGDQRSCKTELLLRYTGDYKTQRYKEYVTPRFQDNIQSIIVDHELYSIHFIDAEVDDDYEILRKTAYEKADCILLCYSIRSKPTFDNLSKKWCLEIRKYAPFTPIILIGTEAELRRDASTIASTSTKVDDITTSNIVTVKQGENLKLLIGAYAFIECSIENFLGIDDIFIEAVRSTHNRTRI